VALIDSIREAVGDEAALMFVKKFGGRKVYVPIKASEGHPIAQQIGLQPAAKLSRRFGGEYLQVPTRWFRRIQIVELDAAGMRPSEISRKLGCSRQWVTRVLQHAD
jgi:Mor family transcriptional regulator